MNSEVANEVSDLEANRSGTSGPARSRAAVPPDDGERSEPESSGLAGRS